MSRPRLHRYSVSLLIVFLVLASAILSRSPKSLNDFDQPVYLTIAYDLDRHGIFSNGVFDDIDSTVEAPKPGMIFAPLYPALVLAAMKIDSRFAEAVRCALESDRGHREPATCEVYATPMLLLHALFLTIGVMAIARASEEIFGRRRMFWLAGAFATAAVIAEADLFSFVMTESTAFGLYGALALMITMTHATGRPPFALAGGVLLGLLCLTRVEYVVLFPLLLGYILWCERARRSPEGRLNWIRTSAFALAFLAVFSPWVARNALSVGKLGLSEEYGSASLIERFAFDDMTAPEYFLAFPYCVAPVGPPAVAAWFGEDAMRRFQYDSAGSFFAVGRAHRNALLAAHGKLDPIIGGVIREELQRRWWRYLLVIIPLAWCGMWVSAPVSLVLLPLFAFGCACALRRSRSLFLAMLIYAAPALVMLGLHAAVANHYTRYNLILIGPLSMGAAFALSRRLESRQQVALGAA